MDLNKLIELLCNKYTVEVDFNGFNIIKHSIIYKDYLKYKCLPSIDQLLDWRNRLMELKNESSIKLSSLYDTEIKAIDYLLNIHNKI